MQQQVSLEWLVEQARRGDQRAIASLYEFSYKEVYYVIHSVIADQDTALDITQDAFMKAFASLNTLGDPTKFTAWVKVIGRNLSLNYLKAKKPVLFSELTPNQADEDYELPFEDLSQGANPERVVDQQETTRLVREILDTLSESQRLAVGLYYYQSMSIKEIAYQTGMSESSVKVHLHNGRKRIEAKVRELEQQGIKLYSLAPLPFLVMLFRSISMVFNPYTDPSAAGLINKLYNGMAKTAPQPQAAPQYQPPYQQNFKPSAGRTTQSISAAKQAPAAKAATGGIQAAAAVKTAGKVAAGKIAAIVAGSILGVAALGAGGVAAYGALTGNSLFAKEESSLVREEEEEKFILAEEESSMDKEEVSLTEEEQTTEMESAIEVEEGPFELPDLSVSGLEGYLSELYSYMAAEDYPAICDYLYTNSYEMNQLYYEAIEPAMLEASNFTPNELPPVHRNFYGDKNMSEDLHLIYVPDGPNKGVHGYWERDLIKTDNLLSLCLGVWGVSDSTDIQLIWINGNTYHELYLADLMENGIAVHTVEAEIHDQTLTNVKICTASSLTRYVIRIDEMDYWYVSPSGEISIEGSIDRNGESFDGTGMNWTTLADNLIDHAGYGHSYPVIDGFIDEAEMENRGLVRLYGGENYSVNDFLEDEGVWYVIDYSSYPMVWCKVDVQGEMDCVRFYVRQGSNGLISNEDELLAKIFNTFFDPTDFWSGRAD